VSRQTSLIGLGIGLAAAGVGAAVGLAAERLAVGRPIIRRFPHEDDEVPLGSLREVPLVVVTDDGTALHVEIDEPQRPDPDGLTVVFSHGYALNLDSWHFQRLSLQGRVRTVWWDQRGHGRSEQGPKGSATIDQLGADLATVIRAVTPSGPLVLIGHSMGGMTVMAFAAANPAVVRDRVVGVGFVSTSAGDLAGIDLGLDRLGNVLHRLAPRTLSLLARQPGIVERTRRIGSDLEEVIVKRWSYSSDVDADLVDFTARMIAATRLEVVSDFMPQFAAHDQLQGLTLLRDTVGLVITGDKDLMIPPEHSQVISEVLDKAEFAVVKDAGHLVMLEHPEVVTPHLVALLHRVRRGLTGETVVDEPTARPVRPRRRRRPGRVGRSAKAAD
jgi:pimeloyl-ACP methyl ester carboxylesterase